MRGRQGRERLVAPPSRTRTGVDGAAGSASASSSMAEQRAFNPLVQGSTPWGRTPRAGSLAKRGRLWV